MVGSIVALSVLSGEGSPSSSLLHAVKLVHVVHIYRVFCKWFAGLFGLAANQSSTSVVGMADVYHRCYLITWASFIIRPICVGVKMFFSAVVGCVSSAGGETVFIMVCSEVECRACAMPGLLAAAPQHVLLLLLVDSPAVR